MRVMIKKWGNSASVRIPTSIMDAARLHLNEPVDINEKNGQIIIKPLQNKKYKLAELLAGVTSKNLHTDSHFSTRMGKEIF